MFYLIIFIPLSVSGKLTGTLSRFIVRVKPASFGLLCAWRGVLNLRQHLLQHQPDSTSQMLGVHPIELRLTQSMKQVDDRLIVGIEHVPQSWSKEVHRLDIACVHLDIPKDLALSAEKRRHPLTPHLVVLAIEM
jgi:hypothetical protein